MQFLIIPEDSCFHPLKYRSSFKMSFLIFLGLCFSVIENGLCILKPDKG